MEVERSVALALVTRWPAPARFGVVLVAASLSLLSSSGCSFEQSPLVSGSPAPSGAPSSSGGGGDGSDDDPGAPSSPIGLASDAGTPPVTRPPPSAGASGSAAGSDAQPPIDAGQDASEQVLDAGMHDEPDTGAPDSGCAQDLECVCAHERLETPDDPCAAPDCPLSECAPDDDCELKRFGSSVYYLCSDARAQDDAAERCESIEDMHLVYIESEDEDAFLDALIDGKVWIGAVADEDRVWSWLDGTSFYDEEAGEPLGDAYVDWDEGSNEPNGLGVGSGSVTCAISWSDTGAWADTNCTALNSYVCEREL